MCGILGAVPSVDADKFARALGSLSHRGPDGGGTWADDRHAALGHRRLAIIDTSSLGFQPMHYVDRFHITYNGEIYNFLELKADLEERGHRFVSDSDTEVLIAAFAEWGEDCLARLNGMWAFAIWDSRDRRLFLARDRVGEKPLFYCQIGKQFVFASEQKALLPFLHEVRPHPQFRALCRNPYAYEAAADCLFDGIERFPAGHFGWLADNRLTLSRYWSPMTDQAPDVTRYEDQVAHLGELLVDSCRLRMRADVPIGTALSGGIDSSAVAAGIARSGRGLADSRLSKNWQNAFVAGFPNTVMDESQYARDVAAHLDIPLTEVVVDPAAALGQLERWMYLFEEVHEVNPIPHILLYQRMRQDGIVVSLDGHGGDELFCGYESSILHALPSALAGGAGARGVLETYNGIHPQNSQFRGMSKPRMAAYLLRAPLRRRRNARRFATSPDMSAGDSLTKHLMELTFHTTLPTLLRNYDRYSMINGVEVRIPLLDHRIIEFAFSLPWTSKVRDGYSKSVLRDAIDAWLPASIVRRKTKIGFAPPIIDWMRGPLKTYLLDETQSSSLRQSTLVDPAKLRGSVEDLLAGGGQRTLYGAEQIWKEFCIYLWEKTFLLNGSNAVSAGAPTPIQAAGHA